MREFLGVFHRQGVRDRGEELGHLHQRALQPAEHGAQILGMRGTIGFDAEHPRAGDARRDAADGTGGARHATEFTEQVAAFGHSGAIHEAGN